MGPRPKLDRAQMGPRPKLGQGPNGTQAQIGSGFKWDPGPKWALTQNLSVVAFSERIGQGNKIDMAIYKSPSLVSPLGGLSVCWCTVWSILLVYCVVHKLYSRDSVDRTDRTLYA